MNMPRMLILVLAVVAAGAAAFLGRALDPEWTTLIF